MNNIKYLWKKLKRIYQNLKKARKLNAYGSLKEECLS